MKTKCTACRGQTNPAVGRAGAAVIYRFARRARKHGYMLFLMLDGKSFRQVKTETSHETPTKVIQGVNKTLRFDKQQLWLDSVNRTEAEFFYVEVLSSQPEDKKTRSS